MSVLSINLRGNEKKERFRTVSKIAVHSLFKNSNSTNWKPSLTTTTVILLARIWEPDLASRCHPHVTNQEEFLCTTSRRHHQSQGQRERRGRLVHTQKSSANCSCQRQTNKYLGLSGHMVPVTMTHLCYWSAKTAPGNTQANEHGCVPTESYLQKQTVGWSWPMGHCFANPDLGI